LTQKVYERLPNVRVRTLKIDERDLNAQRVNTLMCCSTETGGKTPLYMHVVHRVLRTMKLGEQLHGRVFNLSEFKRLVEAENLLLGQAAPFKQRIDTLDSFLYRRDEQSRRMGYSAPSWNCEV
jgi:hypothetical protein